jgi:hypothetical protein
MSINQTHTQPSSKSGCLLLVIITLIMMALSFGIYWSLMNDPVGSHGKRPQTVKPIKKSQ